MNRWNRTTLLLYSLPFMNVNLMESISDEKEEPHNHQILINLAVFHLIIFHFIFFFIRVWIRISLTNTICFVLFCFVFLWFAEQLAIYGNRLGKKKKYLFGIKKNHRTLRTTLNLHVLWLALLWLLFFRISKCQHISIYPQKQSNTNNH